MRASHPHACPRARLLLAGALLLSLTACGGGGSGGRPDPAGPGSRGTLGTSIDLAPAAPAPNDEFSASFRYTISPGTVLLGSYQAEIRFDPARVQLVASDSAISGNRIPNMTRAASGTVGVAGASTTGFSDGLLFRGTFRALGPGVDAGAFVLDVSEAFDTSLESLVD